MKEFLESIKNDYFNFMHFKQEQDEEIEKLEEKKKKLEADIEAKGMEKNEHLNGDYENGIEQREDEIVRINCKISELGIGKEMTKRKEISNGIKMFEIAKYDDKIKKLKREKEKLENEISDIKEGCKTRYKIQIEQNGIKNEIYSVDEEIERINHQIEKRREPIENRLDEKIKIESNIIDKTLKEMEEKINAIEQDQLQTQQDIVDLEELDVEEELIDLKKETIERLLDEFNEKKSKVEKEYYVLKELYEKHQDDLNELKKLKQGLYIKTEKKVKEVVEKSNNEQEIEVDENNQENKKNNYDEIKIENKKPTKKENFITKLINKIKNKKIKDDEPRWDKDSNGNWYLRNGKKPTFEKEREDFNKRLQENVEPNQTATEIQSQKQEENIYKLDEKGQLVKGTEQDLSGPEL